MELSVRFNDKNYKIPFTMTEDDRAKLYFIELNDPALREVMGTSSTTISYSKIENKYDPQASPGRGAELQGSIIDALEVSQRNMR